MISEKEQKVKAIELAELCKYGNDFCIKGLATAIDYLKKGDIFIYTVQTKLASGLIVPIPVIAILVNRPKGERYSSEYIDLEEIRGNGPDQSIKPEFIPIAKKWVEDSDYVNKGEILAKFYDQEMYNAIKLKVENLANSGEDLNPNELKFLYEIYRPVYLFELDVQSNPRFTLLGKLKQEREAKMDTDVYQKMFPGKRILHLGRVAQEKDVNELRSVDVVVGVVSLTDTNVDCIKEVEEITGELYIKSDGKNIEDKLDKLKKLRKIKGIEVTDEDKRWLLGGGFKHFPEGNDRRMGEVKY